MKTQIEIISGLCNKWVYQQHGSSYSIDELESVQKRVNDFCKNHDVVDIKVNTFTVNQHNNGGDDRVKIVYTIIYKVFIKSSDEV